MVYESPNDHGHFDAKGVDIARRDNAVWHREFYAAVMHAICPRPPFTRGSIIEAAVKIVSKELEEIVQDRVPLEKYVITKTIKDASDYAAGQRGEIVNLPQVQAADRFKKRIETGLIAAEPPRSSDRVPYVICAGKLDGPTHSRAEHVVWVKAKNIPPCRLYYLKHLASSVQRFTDATLYDTQISILFEKALSKVEADMKRVNARLSGNMSLADFGFCQAASEGNTRQGKISTRSPNTTKRQKTQCKTAQGLEKWFNS